jgi:hypothetical protein
MTLPLKKLVLLFWLGTPVVVSVAAQEPVMPPPPPMMPSPAEPEGTQEWLDEVRAQRRAWEERRRAAREAMDARRRLIDPWGAAQQEAREKRHRLRRDAFLDKIDREREAFRSRVPWASQQPSRQETPRSSPPPQRSAESEPGESPKEAGALSPPATPYPPLPGWDNRWYYRGY